MTDDKKNSCLTFNLGNQYIKGPSPLANKATGVFFGFDALVSIQWAFCSPWCARSGHSRV